MTWLECDVSVSDQGSGVSRRRAEAIWRAFARAKTCDRRSRKRYRTYDCARCRCSERRKSLGRGCRCRGGARFVVSFLPLAESTRKAHEAAATKGNTSPQADGRANPCSSKTTPILRKESSTTFELEGYDVQCRRQRSHGSRSRRRPGSPISFFSTSCFPRWTAIRFFSSIRQSDRQVPVIILSARGEEADKVRGFKLDADQYVTKPFSIVELLERIAALLRRARPADRAHRMRITFGDVVIDLAARTVTRNGITVRAHAESLRAAPRAGEARWRSCQSQ